MVSDTVYIDELANTQQPQGIDSSIIGYVVNAATEVISLEMFNEGVLWEVFANSKEPDYLGDIVLADAEELRWEEAFARSADTLAQLAEEALAEHRKGLTQVLDPDKL